MHSPQINTSDDMISEDPTSILRVFGDFNSRVRSTVGGNSASNVRSIGSSILGAYGSTSTSQRLRLVILTHGKITISWGVVKHFGYYARINFIILY